MGMSCFSVFSDSRLWECRVFTLLHANLQGFLRAVYGNVVFYSVFCEPFMGMSSFYAVSL